MVLAAEDYDKTIFSASKSMELNRVSLAELLRRRDELRFLKLQYDSEKSMEDIRYSCIVTELAEVERQISVLRTASKTSSDEQRADAEEDLLRQKRIG